MINSETKKNKIEVAALQADNEVLKRENIRQNKCQITTFSQITVLPVAKPK